MIQSFEGLTGDESDHGEEEAAEAENTSENARICDDGQLLGVMFSSFLHFARRSIYTFFEIISFIV